MKNILIKPLITEKMTQITESLNQYGFVVNLKANKLEIKAAVQDRYNVSVKDVSTIIMPAKAKQRFTKAGILSGRKSSFKKAIVTLSEGDSIDFYESI